MLVRKLVRRITLIIGVAGFVDDDQVAAFQQAFRGAELPFAKIYINTPFHRTRGAYFGQEYTCLAHHEKIR